VFVVGKNYRLQNIQLSKIRLAGHLPAIWNVGHRSERRLRSAKRSVPTSVQERPEGLVTPPKLFKERPAPRLACLAEAALWSSAAKAGGEYRARTGDLLVANQALSQLS
jgi:hypothetical protein